MSAQQQWLENRLNVCTAMTFEELTKLPLVVRCNMFFTWDGIDDESLLSSFRRISDDYNTGKIGRDEARASMMEYARENGRDDGTNDLRNLASTARLNLIIDQNASMAHAVGEYERMYSPSALRVFPYMRYQASEDDPTPRHQRHDGMIFEKSDPWLRTHWPPWDFGCHCQLVQITARQAGKAPDMIQAPTPADKVNIESASGFVFDPASALVKTGDGYRAYTTDELRKFL